MMFFIGRDAFHRVPISRKAPRANRVSVRSGRGSDARCARADDVGRMGRSGIRPYQTNSRPKSSTSMLEKITSYVGGYDYFLKKTGALDDERVALTAG